MCEGIPPNRYLSSTPYKRYDRLKNSLRASRSSLADARAEHLNWKISPKLIMGIIITIPLINVWWLSQCRGMDKSLANAPALPDQSYLVRGSWSTLCHTITSARLDHDNTRSLTLSAAIPLLLLWLNSPPSTNITITPQPQHLFTLRCHRCLLTSITADFALPSPTWPNTKTGRFSTRSASTTTPQRPTTRDNDGE